SSKVFAEAPERLRESFVRGVSNAVLLQSQSRIEKRTAASKPVYRFIGRSDVRLNCCSHLFVKARERVLPRRCEGKIHSLAQLGIKGFDAALQLIVMQRKHVIELRLKFVQRSLFEAESARQKLIQAFHGRVCALDQGIQPSRFSLCGFAQ